MKRMLINATQKEELRVAIVDGQKLIDLDIEGADNQTKKSNIYKGKITRVEPSLDAAFVEYGADRHGFLPLKEIWSGYFSSKPESGAKINIRQVLKEGQEILVQIDKDERGNKGAALTTFISLAGRFMVLMPNNPRGGGVSRRIAGEERDEIRATLKEIEVPDGMSVIVRTAGIGRTAEELNWDLDYLKGVWSAIVQVVDTKAAPFLIFQDNSPVIRALRDHLNSDIGEIIVDSDETIAEAREFMEHAMPHNIKKLLRYEEPVPLFTRFQIESQIESAFSHSVSLPSGGSVVIDPTEALVSIDINSARATKGSDIEATALQTNLEAADEIARQCRLRDMGGLLVIDFIDMGPSRNQRDVENRLRDAMRPDRARIQIGKISRFGLLEMSRQRMRRSLGESAHQVCPRCSGAGTVRDVESLGLSILRLMGEEGRKDMTAKVIAELPVEVATYLLNEKRDWILDIEKRDGIQLLLVANPSLETPHYAIRRVRNDQVDEAENAGASYTLTTPEENLTEAVLETSINTVHEAPAVSAARPAAPVPVPTEQPQKEAAKSGVGFFGWLKGIFGGSNTEEKKAEERKQQSRNNNNRDRDRDRNRSGNSNNRNRNRNRNRKGGRDGDNRRNQSQNRDSQKDSQKEGNKDGQRDGRKGNQGNRNQPKGDNRNDNRNDNKGDKKQNENQDQAAASQGPDNQQEGNQQNAEGGNENRKRRNRRRRRGGNRGKTEGEQQQGGENAQQANPAGGNTATPMENPAPAANATSEAPAKSAHVNTPAATASSGSDQAKPAPASNAAPQTSAPAPKQESAPAAPAASTEASKAPAQPKATQAAPATPAPAAKPATSAPAASSAPAAPAANTEASKAPAKPKAAQAAPAARPATPAPAANSAPAAPKATAPAAPKAPAANTAPAATPAPAKPAAPAAVAKPAAPAAPAAPKPAQPTAPAATPAAAAPQAQKQAPAKPAAPAKPVADKDRKLPWETSAPGGSSDKPTKVWSSTDSKAKGPDDR